MTINIKGYEVEHDDFDERWLLYAQLWPQGVLYFSIFLANSFDEHAVACIFRYYMLSF